MNAPRPSSTVLRLETDQLGEDGLAVVLVIAVVVGDDEQPTISGRRHPLELVGHADAEIVESPSTSITSCLVSCGSGSPSGANSTDAGSIA